MTVEMKETWMDLLTIQYKFEHFRGFLGKRIGFWPLNDTWYRFVEYLRTVISLCLCLFPKDSSN